MGRTRDREGGQPEHGHKLKLLVWNVHGIGGRSADANTELKIIDVCSMVKLHDITVLLTETRTSDAPRLFQHLPGFTVHNIQLDRGNEGKNGHVIAVLVAPSCSDYVRVLKTSENVQPVHMAAV